MNTHRFIAAAAAVALVAVPTAHGQSAKRSEARWQGWYGCWSSEPRDLESKVQGRTVCLTPTSSVDVVEVAALADGKIIHRDTIDASGRAQQIASDGCTGTQTGRWSDDGRRVFLKSVTTCSGALTTTTAVIAMTPFGEWIDVRSVSSVGHTNVNVAHYRDIGITAAIPNDIITAIRGYGPNIEAARLASGVPIPAEAVVEASKAVDARVLEAWVAQSGLEFVTDAKSLQQLADAGIPAEVTDAMVTVAANSRDVYDTWAGVPRFGRQSSDYWDQGTGQRVVFTTTTMDPWGYGIGGWRYGRQYTRYAFGTNNWSWLYGPNWGYNNPFGVVGFNSNTVGSILPPTIVLHNDPTNTSSRGRASTTRTAAPSVDAPVADPKKESILEKAIRQVTGVKQAGDSKTSPR